MRQENFDTVTLDTGALPADDLLRAAEGLGLDFKVVTVTSRETENTDITVALKTIYETAVWGESRWDQCVWADKPGESVSPGTKQPVKGRLEVILEIISNGSFPTQGRRESMTDGQTSQLRDAMIFEAHVREGRDVFVTMDKKAFLGPKTNPDDLRRKLEERFKTCIMTPDDFKAYCSARKNEKGN